MDQPPAVAFTAFADAWPRAIETETGAALCAIGAGKDFDFDFESIYLKPDFDWPYPKTLQLKFFILFEEFVVSKLTNAL